MSRQSRAGRTLGFIAGGLTFFIGSGVLGLSVLGLALLFGAWLVFGQWPLITLSALGATTPETHIWAVAQVCRFLYNTQLVFLVAAGGWLLMKTGEIALDAARNAADEDYSA